MSIKWNFTFVGISSLSNSEVDIKLVIGVTGHHLSKASPLTRRLDNCIDDLRHTDVRPTSHLAADPLTVRDFARARSPFYTFDK